MMNTHQYIIDAEHARDMAVQALERRQRWLIELQKNLDRLDELKAKVLSSQTSSNVD